MAHTTKQRDKLLARVKRIRGQADGIEKLLNQDGDCAKVLQQIAAIRGAVNGLMSEVLEGHIREHLGSHEATTQERDADIEQVVAILRSYMK
ncbi:metal/formaldehyde-sensitive transcriptional repressor [Gilvimarinus japonicus]|jgi:DNA-binding FrmR family transcriptional regulator|uniref:Metal/formaldehyde-sensitive transcriptional repressor n=1 Tax=Gilvimarinus japonicus TaxID=1796469 RepID=A0ABV7HP98_9GAMM